MRRAAGALAVAAVVVLTAGESQARTLQVGPEASYPGLGQALMAAAPGDTIHLAAGSYYECASIRVADLVIEGEGDETLLTDKTCEGKAILVAHADRLTLRNLVLTRARVADLNGAGVRLEGQGLVAERVRFDNDQVGVLAAAAGPGTVRISDCVFTGGGVAGERPTFALWIGGVAELIVERSRFADVRGGQVSTSAVRSELTGNSIGTGVEEGAGAAVNFTGGALVMQDNVLSIGPHAPPRDAAVVATGEAATLRGNRMENTTGRAEVLFLDWMHGSPTLEANTVGAGDSVASMRGSWRHRAGGVARELLGGVRSTAGATKRALKALVGR